MIEEKMPSGIYSLSGNLALSLEQDKRKLIDNYLSSGYQLVIPPPINFTTNIENNSSFKFSDTSSANTLEIVADITKQVAIIDSKEQKSINKYCYCAQIIKPFADDFYSSRMPMQAGCEIYGDNSLEADCEIINTMLNSLELLGLKNIKITLSNLAIFTNAIDTLDLPNKDEILKLIFSRSKPDLDAFIKNNNINSKHQEAFYSLMSGDLTQITSTFATQNSVLEQIEKLTKLHNLLNKDNICIDITDNKAYDYHNNLLFSAYNNNFSKAVARGGRYNLINDRVATGFSFDLNFIRLT